MWKQRIRSASYKGVPFGVLDASGQGGRRTVVHEFPLRDVPYIEDLGRAARTFTVQGFLLGPTFMEQRDALISALEEPGPGLLVHPWYGELEVVLTGQYQDRHSAVDGGMCVISMTFTRDGESGAAVFSVNARLSALGAASAAGNLACAAFDAAALIFGESAYIVEQAFDSLSGALEDAASALGLDTAGGVEGLLPSLSGVLPAGVAGSVADYVLPGLSLGRSVWTLFQDLGETAATSARASGVSPSGALAPDSNSASASGWIQAASAAALASGAAVPTNPGYTRSRIARNRAVIASFALHLSLIEASSALADAAPESRVRARALRDAYTDAMDAALESDAGVSHPILPGPGDSCALIRPAPLPDDLYAALVDMRAGTLAALAEAAKAAPEVTEYRPSIVQPSLALAWRLAGDVLPDADLVARNRVPHPGFVPVEELEVLTYA
ncbi:MAG: DNA circularization N-terminal domain-containing protein [Desulfovibrio sp.]|jgi:prophage DNA circulation protein|nr:DNA circularization N-terminal domain-containing protein [Desulfovibrio sp.]